VRFVERFLEAAPEETGLPDGFRYDEERGLTVDGHGRPLVAEPRSQRKLVATSVSSDIDTFARRDVGTDTAHSMPLATQSNTDVDTRAAADREPHEDRAAPRRVPG
jgi:hypothetical protein